MRAMLIVIALLMFSMVVAADDKEKKAKAAFAFQQQKSHDVKADRAKELFSAQPPAADDCSPDCHCHDTATCKCEPGHCTCCETNLPAYPEQSKKALERGFVLVGYFGTNGKGTCFDGAISAAGGQLQGHPPQTILIGYPHDGKLLISDELPATSKRADIEAAIKKAKAKMVEGQPVSIPPSPAVVAPVAPAQTWFVAGPSPVTICRT